jgi:hypothetical protein
MTGIRGPVPGKTAGRKRKNVSELSENIHTKRGRLRLERIKEQGLKYQEIERAKKNDNAAINRAKAVLKKQNHYVSASSDRQKELEAELKGQVLEKRHVLLFCLFLTMAINIATILLIISPKV